MLKINVCKFIMAKYMLISNIKYRFLRIWLHMI